jgi:glycogen(starch) synthase
MRILTLSNLYPPHHLGGYELSCRDVMDRFTANGHEVRVLTSDVRLERAAREDAPQHGVHRELRIYWDDHLLLRPPLRARVAIERANQGALARHLDEHRPEVVSAWNMGAMSLGMLTTVLERRIPLVLNVCDDWLVYGPDLDPWSRPLFRRPRLAGVVRRATGVPSAPRALAPDVTICFVSEYVRERARAESGFRMDALAGSTVVYSGIEHAEFPPDPEPAPRPWGGRLLYTGRLDERKGVFTALDALRLLPPDHRLDLVFGGGDPEVEARLRAEAASAPLCGRVGFDTVPRPQLASRYRGADAFLFTSEWAEPFGLTPVEAMACATPVVATATGGSAEFLVDGVNCVRYPAGDAGALADAVRRLAGDADLRARLVEGGLVTAGQLGVEALASTLEDWHVAAATRYPTGPPPHRRLGRAA